MPHPKLFSLGLFLSALPLGASTSPDWHGTSVPSIQHPGTGQVFYFVLTDRFANGDTSNDTGHIPGGRDQHGFDPSVISHYHGGDFRGMTAKLDYLRNLGVSAIWITPPFKNKPVQETSAGYHGYWILDFTRIDPHLGTEEDFRNFVQESHARGIRVYLDIVANHTADVIHYKEGSTSYREIKDAPYRDAQGHPFDAHQAAWNGIGNPYSFPKLDASRSFAYTPIISTQETNAKGPAWLNNPLYYHNRGNSLFRDENSLHGDFVGLDDLFTEQPAVVNGFIALYSAWLRNYGIDGFRIDTVKHVNLEFWQAFGPALRNEAQKLGRPDFFQFGEVADDRMEIPLLSAFSTLGALDATLDFGFFEAVRRHVSKGEPAAVFTQLFDLDDYYTDHDSNVQGTPTFVSNHDAGRFGYFLRTDNPGITDDQCAKLVLLAHGLLLSARGQPVIYYGDEQGMAGTGNDMAAREDMFPSNAKGYRELSLLGTAKKGTDDKFDTSHPFYREIAKLAALRRSHPGLRQGSTIPHETGHPAMLAFSRIDRDEQREYLAIFNSSRSETLSATIPTSQSGTPDFELLYQSDTNGTPAKGQADKTLHVSLKPMQFGIWAAKKALPQPGRPIAIRTITPSSQATIRQELRSIDGHSLPKRVELSATTEGGDGLGELSFFLRRHSKPNQLEYLGTDTAAPYRIFWTVPTDLAATEQIDLIVTADDLRGHKDTQLATGLQISSDSQNIAILGSELPALVSQPLGKTVAKEGATIRFELQTKGTQPLTYQWFKREKQILSGSNPYLELSKVKPNDADEYHVLISNQRGTIISQRWFLEVQANAAARN